MNILFLIGRVLFGGLFFMSGINHFQHLGNMSAYAKSKNVPMPKLAVVVSGLLALLGGLWIMLGVYARVGLYELIVFLVPVTLMMHNFWSERDAQQKMNQRVMFMKNMALLGATLMMLMLPEVWPYAFNIR